MFYHIEEPNSMKGDTLDEYHNKGWFRLRHKIDKGSHFVNVEDISLLKVIELRYDVDEIVEHRSHKRMRMMNRKFRVEHSQTFEVTPADLVLYLNYCHYIDFDTYDDIEDVLTGNGKLDIFDTRCIRIFDEDELIALGLYDVGTNSIASIMNCYDPNYAIYSLGKYIMLLITDMMRYKEMKYYYPGYLMVGNPTFDYKLFIGKEAAYYLNSESHWERFKEEILVYEKLSPKALDDYLDLYHAAYNNSN